MAASAFSVTINVGGVCREFAAPQVIEEWLEAVVSTRLSVYIDAGFEDILFLIDQLYNNHYKFELYTVSAQCLLKCFIYWHLKERLDLHFTREEN